MEVLKNGHEEFVTVVSVGNTKEELDNFVTVLSIGNGMQEKDVRSDVVDVVAVVKTVEEKMNIDKELKEDEINGSDGHPEEEVDVFRLPGERLGFGLKFEGGNKTSEKVRKLFVQSCASESPASRAVCSWGTLGEGDEVLNIDGVSVTEMTRLDCVRRLKESQLVIKLLVRYRGALRPEVVSAERKSSAETKRNKVPPELPSAPPPVPPRKLRQPRGPADGDANPSPVRKPWDSPNKSVSSSPASFTESPTNKIQNSFTRESRESSKSTSYESCNSSPAASASSKSSSKNSSPKNSTNSAKQSPDLINIKSIQEPAEASIYLDARSHDGCSNQGSTSDDTGSSMSTVIDCRFSSSDRFSTISTISTASTASEHQQSSMIHPLENVEQLKESSPMEISAEENIDLVRLLAPFDQLEREFGSNPPTTDYLLSRLANSEAVTFVESLGDGGDGVVERVTAVVAPNTVLIEETITLQPPLSFQDAPLSYGHETRPGLVYTDLAADSTTHFRPIKDDALIVDCVNGNVDQVVEGPPLPARNHVNRINVNQDSISVDKEDEVEAPALPPKPMPRKDVKSKRKRPPPPPPPPRREVKPLPIENIGESEVCNEGNEIEKVGESLILIDDQKIGDNDYLGGLKIDPNVQRNNEKNLLINKYQETNKMMEIIEMKKVKALSERSKSIESEFDDSLVMVAGDKENEEFLSAKKDELFSVDSENKKNKKKRIKNLADYEIRLENKGNNVKTGGNEDAGNEDKNEDDGGLISVEDEKSSCKIIENVRDEVKNSDASNRRSIVNDNAAVAADDEEDSTDESDGDSYYWQSNLATIGEEEETNSLEFTSANRNSDTDDDLPNDVFDKIKSDSYTAADDGDEVDCLKQQETICCNNNENKNDKRDSGREENDRARKLEDKLSLEKSPVNGRMDNCGGGQRLPPDGDEFPATYQEFSTSSSQQYQFVAGARVSSTLGSSNGDLVAGDSSEVFTTSETFKLLPAQQTDVINKIIPNLSGDLSHSNKQDKKTVHLSEIKVPAVADCKPRNVNSMLSIDDFNYYNKCGNDTNVVSEKKINISGYYGNDQFKNNDSIVKESSPPPLPTSRPPKADVAVGANASSPGLSRGNQPHRKFSLNGDLWRQDDKSEKSVRDKIAMFSSQSSLEAPLFPSIVSSTATITSQPSGSCARRLSKYKSSEDVFAEEGKLQLKEKTNFNERTRSSFDLTTSSPDKYDAAPPSLPLTSPPGSPRSKIMNTSFISKTESENVVVQESKPTARHSISLLELKSVTPSTLTKSNAPLKATTSFIGPVISSSVTLSRATSFSGGSSSLHSRSQSLSDLPPSPQISRTNSLASTFRRPSDDMRRASLNQLIEQRRKGISKLRGLVIPEKETLPLSQPIVDLPEIKSRDSILLQQIPRASIHDKWGSQSSISSSISTTSVPGKIATSFKMPEPQNLPKYSPAFKRKSLAVYGTSSPAATTVKNSTVSEAPKSLESICSPTRSDFSFEYVPTSGSQRSRTTLRKARTDYDDSDNDSAVSSSQSSISRGFSPPVSPVPSERSTLSSERSYISAETNNSGNFNVGESRGVNLDRSQFSTRPSYHSERSSSSSSSPDPRSPQQSEIYTRNTLHHHALKRSSSTDTNCSTSSTLTSGSQASAESLSRRVLKPQSVEAINRKNILASARCRSGRDLNGSPLIQRKFSDDEETPVSKLAQDNGSCGNEIRKSSTNGDKISEVEPDVKIAYIEVSEEFTKSDNDEDSTEILPVVQPSNDLKKWVRAEIKTLVNSSVMENQRSEQIKKVEETEVLQIRTPRRRSSLANNEDNKSSTDALLTPRNRSSFVDDEQQQISLGNSKPRSRSSLVLETKNNENQNDLITVLSTKSRSRSAIHIEERSFGRSRSQMSLEEILDGKGEENSATSLQNNNSGRSWIKDKGFASKIPTPEKVVKVLDKNEDNMKDALTNNQKINSSKIPTSRSLGRRSASVTDMKKAIEKSESASAVGNISQGQNQSTTTTNSHSRFPSLDSSGVEDQVNHRIICGDIDSERYSASEQFGSISSLASSTSLISQQELAQLVEEATSEEPKGAHDVIVVLYHKENPAGSVGIALAGGVDCETKEITVHRVLAHSIADKDGRVQRGDRILSINGRSTKGLSHRESLSVLKQPRSEVVLVVSRARDEISGRLRSRTESVETIVEGSESNGSSDEQTAWGPPASVVIFKDGAGLGFSLEGGRDSPLGDKPLMVKKIFAGGAAEKTGALRAGDQMLEVNGNDVTRMSRIEAWSLMKKLNDGEVSLLVRHPATKSSS